MRPFSGPLKKLKSSYPKEVEHKLNKTQFQAYRLWLGHQFMIVIQITYLLTYFLKHEIDLSANDL